MESTDVTFEKILESVGDNGRHQKLLFWLLVVPFNFLIPWVPLAPIFMSWVPDHKCLVPGQPDNISLSSWDNFTLPWIKDDEGSFSLSKCKQFNIAEEDLLHVTDSDPNFQPFKTTTSCQHGWKYDQSEYLETLATSQNWVCEREEFVSHWLSVGLAGNVIGTLIFNSLSDFIGRKIIFLLTCLICGVFGVVRLYVTSYWAIMVTQFIASMPFPSNLELCLIIVFEQASGNLRSQITAASFILWTAGMCLLPLLAWATQHWVTLGLITSVPFFIFMPGWWLLTESPRWLLSQGRFKETNNLLQTIAKRNGIEAPKNLEEQIIMIHSRSKVTITEENSSYIDKPPENLQETNSDKNNPDLNGTKRMATNISIQNKTQTNDKSEPSETQKDAITCTKKIQETNFGALQLLIYPVVWKRTILLTVCYSCNNLFYYGLIYNISNMSGNEFLNFFLLGVTEFPANLLGWWGSQVIGRRWTESLCFIIASFFCLLAIVVQDLSPWYNIILLTISKLIITVSFMVIYIQCAEIYPTSHRASGTGLSSLVSSIIGISSPYIASIGKVYPPAPYILIAAVGLIGGICASFLPETLGANLPQSLKDGSSFLVEQKYFSYYGWKPKQKKNPPELVGENNLGLSISTLNTTI